MITDPIALQSYIKQLAKIKHRKNLYLPVDNLLTKEYKKLKEENERINKLEKEVKKNDKIIKNINAKEKNKKTINNEFAQEVLNIQKMQLKKIIEENKKLKREIKDKKNEINIYK